MIAVIGSVLMAFGAFILGYAYGHTRGAAEAFDKVADWARHYGITREDLENEL